MHSINCVISWVFQFTEEMLYRHVTSNDLQGTCFLIHLINGETELMQRLIHTAALLYFLRAAPPIQEMGWNHVSMNCTAPQPTFDVHPELSHVVLCCCLYTTSGQHWKALENFVDWYSMSQLWENQSKYRTCAGMVHVIPGSCSISSLLFI